MTDEIKPTESELEILAKANDLASSEFELVVIDTVSGEIYMRNTDWEAYGGDLYNLIGKVRPEIADTDLVSQKIHRKQNWWNQVKDDRFSWDGVVTYFDNNV